MVGEVGGEVLLRRHCDGPVEGHPIGRGERRLDRVPDESVDEPVVAAVADLLEEAMGDGLVDEGEAVHGRFVDGGGDQADREVPPDDGRRLHQPAAAVRHPVEPGTDHVEDRAWRAVGPPRAVGDGPGDLADEQRVAAGQVEYGPSIRSRHVRCEPRHLLAHLGDAKATQVQALHAG